MHISAPDNTSYRAIDVGLELYRSTGSTAGMFIGAVLRKCLKFAAKVGDGLSAIENDSDK